MGLFSSIKHLFAGRKGNFSQQSLLGPGQQQSFNQLQSAATGPGAGGAFGASADYYRDLLDPNSQTAQQMSAPAMQQFQQDILPDIAEQFAGSGSGALSSSGFRNAGLRAGADLQERLAAMRAGLKQQGAQGLFNIGQQASNPGYYENIYRPRTPGLLESAAAGFGGAIGGGLTGGPSGAVKGYMQGRNMPSQNPNYGGNLGFGQAGFYPTQGNYSPYSN